MNNYILISTIDNNKKYSLKLYLDSYLHDNNF